MNVLMHILFRMAIARASVSAADTATVCHVRVGVTLFLLCVIIGTGMVMIARTARTECVRMS